jgi:tetratricopeptide (TPR) repeat protein
MSLEDIYDADCHLIKSTDTVKEEEDLIESINKKHLDGIGKNQYSIEFLRKLDKLLNEDIIDFDYDDSNYTMEIGCYFDQKGNYDYAKKYYLMAIEKGNSNAEVALCEFKRIFNEKQSLIKFFDNNIELKNIFEYNKIKYKEDNIKVVSIIGSARMGKSTLLNIILSKYGYNNIFPTSKSSTNMCTIGIDYFYVPSVKILFCDVQGFTTSISTDPKLLLVTYMMSDIIIFTEPKMLNKHSIQNISYFLGLIY